MPESFDQDISMLLKAWSDGDENAINALVPLVYDELHRLAHKYRVHENGNSLQTSAIVNEAYLRLVDVQKVEWKDRAHFFAIAARAMRRVLVDMARMRSCQKRGHNIRCITLSESLSCGGAGEPAFVELDDALNALAEFDPRKAKVVEMRFFGGLNLDEIAEVLDVSRITVARDWKMAKLWLLKELG
jgi:RNA polymerase sigma-70 factor, ECF subfamily